MSIFSSYYRQMREHKAQQVAAARPCEFADTFISLLESDLYLLSGRKRRELACIMEEFRTRPLTQKNYLALQRELTAAELMPEQVFCYDLGDDQKKRGDHYMSYIVQSWQKMARGKI